VLFALLRPHGQVWNLVMNRQSERRKNFVRQSDCPSGRLVAWDNATGKSIEPGS